ncbi:MAG: DUF4190 domain-containing protein [Verrucomicrobiota bacterium]
MRWYYADSSNQQQEATPERLAALVESGEITDQTLVWNESLPDWVPLSQASPELFGGAPRPPALTSSQRKELAAIPERRHNYQEPTDAVSICALVFGIVGLFCIPIFSIVAVICGHIGLRRSKEAMGPSSVNKGFSIAGLITGYLGLAILIFIIVVYGAVIISAIAAGEFDADALESVAPKE